MLYNLERQRDVMDCLVFRMPDILKYSDTRISELLLKFSDHVLIMDKVGQTIRRQIVTDKIRLCFCVFPHQFDRLQIFSFKIGIISPDNLKTCGRRLAD